MGDTDFHCTFPIGNLTLEFRLDFHILVFPITIHILGFSFLFYFPFKKNKISGDSKTVLKNGFFKMQI